MGMSRVGAAACFVDGAIVPGDVAIADGKVVDVGVVPAGGNGLACPGFVDTQVNGFAGVTFTGCDLDGYRTASEALARTGVTAWLPTIPSAAPHQYDPALGVARRAQDEQLPGARVLGVHLEGPFLSPARRGAHPEAHLQPAGVETLHRLLAYDNVAVFTMAPELPGAAEVMAELTSRGVVVSLGHTDCDAATAHEAFASGATAVTHLWNAQRPVRARDAGVTGAALTHPGVFVGVIPDLVHVGPEALAITIAAAGDRIVAVTDAVSVAGLPDGEYGEGARTITVRQGMVSLPDGTLAGGAGTLDACVRNLVSVGMKVEQALTAVTINPARMLGRSDVGRLCPDAPADVVVLDDDLHVRRVLVRGDEVHRD